MARMMRQTQRETLCREGLHWSVSHTFRVASDSEYDYFLKRGARVLDHATVTSVASAVEKLNNGTVSCPEGLCLAYSVSSGSNFLLYRQDKRDLAEITSALDTDGAGPCTLVHALVRAPQLPETLKRPGTVPKEKKRQGSHGGSNSPPASRDAVSGKRTPGNATRMNSSSSTLQPGTRTSLRNSNSEERSRVARTASQPQKLGAKTLSSSQSGGTFVQPRQQQRSSKFRAHSGSSSSQGTSHSNVADSSRERRGRSSASTFSPQVRRRVLGPSAAQQSNARTPTSSGSRPRNRPPSSAPLSPNTPAPERHGSSWTPRKDTASPSGSPTDSPPLPDENFSLSADEDASSGHYYEESRRPSQPKNKEVEIGGRPFMLQKVVGRGAFGVVWMARERGSCEDVAVKSVTATDAPAFATAAFEAEVLELLTAAHGPPSVHVPRYIAHSAIRHGAGGIVHMAMSFVAGGSLDAWMYGIKDEDHKTVDVAQLVDGHLPGGQQGAWYFANACNIVRLLLNQLSGVFATLCRIAFHRDVSSHNILVNFRDNNPLQPDFALIDFGLAVRSGSWCREWRNSNLAGDPRYWPPSAWMAFAFGFQYVSTHPNNGFQQQYVHRMDHFSLGVLGLEVLFALWHMGEAYQGNHPGLLEVRAAWCKFWVSVIHLFQMFHRQGAQDVRHFLANSRDEGISCLVSHLDQLRQSLRATANNPVNFRFAALLRVLADLLDEGGSVTWTEIAEMLQEDFIEESPSDEKRPSMLLESERHLREDQGTRRRIRSTGTVDQERRREPDFGRSGKSPTRSAHWNGNPTGASAVDLSKSVANLP